MKWTKVILGLFAAIAMTACNPSGGSRDEVPVSPGKPEGTEKPYNATPISYSGNLTTVTGTATYTRYDDGNSGLASTSTRPIRYAEVNLLNSAGVIIQAGETNATGDFSLPIPRAAGTFTLSVNSRSDNNQIKASVLDTPYDKKYYSLTASFSTDGTETTKALTLGAAPHDGTLQGGAFNILDNIFIANQFLRDESNDAADCSICSNDFTVAPKVQIYWVKGLSPGVYYGAPEVGISFFVPASGGGLYRGLYILGGIEDDLCTDTDHFDNSVILHEYGHFLEDAFGKSASPGGSHSGDELIDPRLAWSEGWADFFQAAALGRSVYRDTSRNASCSGGARLSFPDFNLETKTQNQDFPLADEGIFRELSIARTLYDTVSGPSQSSTYKLDNASFPAGTTSDAVHGDQSFSRLWHVFKSLSGSTNYFQNAGMFNQAMYSSLGTLGLTFPNDYSGNGTSVLDHEKQAKDRSLYGRRLAPTSGAAGACSFSVASGKPNADQVNSSGEVEWSDPLNNNDFFEYHYDGTASTRTLQMRYEKSGSEATNPYDLDLYIYTENYTYLDNSTIVDSDERPYPESTTAPSGLAEVDFTGQLPGVYMLNVKVSYTATRATTSYYLQTSTGAQLCP